MKAPLLAAIAAVSCFAIAQDPAATPAPQPDSLVFTSYEMGITFNYPTTWESQTNKGSTTMRFTVEGGTQPVVLEIFPANFRSEIDIWQISQKTVAEQMHRQVVKQWQEEVLGVPLLLTQSTGTSPDSTNPTTTLSGLVYSATARKMVFRLTCAAPDFEKADYSWRTVMQTMRTTDGTLPKPEDPNRPVTEADLRPLTKPPTRIVIKPPVVDPEKLVKGPSTQVATIGGKQMLVRAPAGWTFEANADGYLLKHEGVPVALQLRLASTLDSVPPGKALMAQSGKTLDLFATVSSREEKGPGSSLSGSMVATIERTGKSSTGDLWTLDGAGQSSDCYWMLFGSNPTRPTDGQRKLIRELVDTLLIEPVAVP